MYKARWSRGSSSISKQVSNTSIYSSSSIKHKVPFTDFSASHLFPNEPKFKRGDQTDLALASKEDLMLPAGWRRKED
jgi:hypothetical protein